jgi:4-hydroxy-4-methyl-2-oxoglutarate aldolase
MSSNPPEATPVGRYRPERIGASAAPALDADLVGRLLRVTGLSSAFSDELDRLGLRLAVPASVLRPLRDGDVAIGPASTLRYLPTRTLSGTSRLAHLTVFDAAPRGAIVVISAPHGSQVSVLGGVAAAAAVEAGVAALIVDGAVRDIDEIDATGLPVWAAAATPLTGRGRLEAIEIDGPVEVGGVHVVAGDVVIADRSGVVFVPVDSFEELAAKVLAA